MKLRFLLLVSLACFLFLPSDSFAQDSLQRPKILEFLKREDLLNQFDARIENASVDMPKRLNEALLYAFPKHRFIHVRLEAGLRSIVSIPADFILVTDIASGEVVAFISTTYQIASGSFKEILKAYQANSWEDALNRVLILGQLIAYPDDDRVGRVYRKGETIDAEVISTFEPYLVLKVKVGKGFKFGRVQFIKVKTGKEEWNYRHE